MITELFLIRHAQTEHNRQKRYCGFSDVSLNHTGMKHARSLKSRISKLKIEVLFSSPLKRTRQTSEILFSERKIVFDPRLKELNFGQWEGLQYNEIIEKYGSFYNEWVNDPFNARPPQGESLLDLQKRCMGFLEFVLKEFKHKKIGIVSHAGPIRVMLIGLNKLRKEDFWDIAVDHLSINRVKVNQEV